MKDYVDALLVPIAKQYAVKEVFNFKYATMTHIAVDMSVTCRASNFKPEASGQNRTLVPFFISVISTHAKSY